LNDESNGSDVTVITFANAYFAHETRSVYYEKIQLSFHHIEHTLYQDASLIHLASFCPQPNVHTKLTP